MTGPSGKPARLQGKRQTGMKYFAYGSNMSVARIRARVPSATVDSIASLAGHVMRFRKRSNVDGSAKCDVIETSNPGDRVWGVVYDIDAGEKTHLDDAEGLGYGYEQKEVELAGPDGETLHAFTYYATDIDDGRKPYTWYTEHVLRGARENGLPAGYVAQIERVEALEDPDRERHDRELSIYR